MGSHYKNRSTLIEESEQMICKILIDTINSIYLPLAKIIFQYYTAFENKFYSIHSFLSYGNDYILHSSLSTQPKTLGEFIRYVNNYSCGHAANAEQVINGFHQYKFNIVYIDNNFYKYFYHYCYTTSTPKEYHSQNLSIREYDCGQEFYLVLNNEDILNSEMRLVKSW